MLQPPPSGGVESLLPPLASPELLLVEVLPPLVELPPLLELLAPPPLLELLAAPPLLEVPASGEPPSGVGVQTPAWQVPFAHVVPSGLGAFTHWPFASHAASWQSSDGAGHADAMHAVQSGPW